MEKMRELRKIKGLTMKQLGQMVGTSESAISFYERGLHEPDITTIKRIADVLGVSVDVLLGRSSEQDDVDIEEDVWAIREKLRRDPESRILFSAAAKVSPEHIRTAAAMLKALKGKDFPDDD